MEPFLTGAAIYLIARYIPKAINMYAPEVKRWFNGGDGSCPSNGQTVETTAAAERDAALQAHRARKDGFDDESSL